MLKKFLTVGIIFSFIAISSSALAEDDPHEMGACYQTLRVNGSTTCTEVERQDCKINVVGNLFIKVRFVASGVCEA